MDPSQAELAELWQAADSDGNNWLSLSEFVSRLGSLDFTRAMVAKEEDSIAAAAVADVSLDKFISSLTSHLPAGGDDAPGRNKNTAGATTRLELLSDMHMPRVYVYLGACGWRVGG